jgi:hypothetical protein
MGVARGIEGVEREGSACERFSLDSQGFRYGGLGWPAFGLGEGERGA